MEKIWILYDVDQNGTLDWDEVKAYITEMAFPHLNFTDKEVEEIYSQIDNDGDRQIDKHEMGSFLTVLMIAQKDLQFKKAEEF